MGEQVFLFHGLGRTPLSMAGLGRALGRAGWEVVNLGYPSRRMALEEIVAYLHSRIGPETRRQGAKMHFVGFSLGGLVIRAYLQAYPETSVGRAVLIGTPNRGSELADALKDRWYYRYFLGPAGKQLVTDQKDFAHLLGPSRAEIGVIAGDRSLEPWTHRHFNAPNDGKVSVESTRLAGMQDHIVLPVAHPLLPVSRQVYRQVAAFLRDGAFDHGPDT